MMDANSLPLHRTALDPSIGIRRLESSSLPVREPGAPARWHELLALLRAQIRRDLAASAEGVERLLDEAEVHLERLFGEPPAPLDAADCGPLIQELEALFAQLEEVLYALGLGLRGEDVRP